MAGLRTATNPETGEKVFFDEASGAWQPLKTATNPQTGEKLYKRGEEWLPMGGAAGALAELSALSTNPQVVTSSVNPSAGMPQRDFALMLEQNPALRSEIDAARNPYTQADTIYDPVTGVPIAGSFTDAPMTTATSALEGVRQGASQGATFGFGDEMSSRLRSAITGEDYDTVLARTRQNIEDSRDSGGFGVGTALGSIAPSSIGAKFASGGASLLGNVVRGAVYGGGQGAAYGFGTGEGGATNRLENAVIPALMGAGVGAAAPLIGAGVKAVAEKMPFFGQGAALKALAKDAPTTEQAKAAGSKAFNDLREAGVVVAPDQFDRAGIQAAMDASGLDTGLSGSSALPLTPGGARLSEIVDDMATNPANNAGMSFDDIMKLRRKAGGVASSVTNPSDAATGAAAIGAIDDMVDALPGGVGGQYATARDLWSRFAKSDTIDNAIEKGGNYVSNSAQGIKNQFATILRNPKLSRGFSDAEKALMRRVVKGTLPEKFLNMFGSGLGQLAASGGGAMAGGPAGLMAGFGISNMARSGVESMTGRNAELVRALVAKGGLKAMPELTPQVRQIIEALVRRSVIPAVSQQEGQQ